MRTPGSPGEAEARGATATFRETSPACLCSQLGAQQQPRSPARETAKPGRGSDGGPNTVRDARSCGGRPHFEARAPPLPDVISGAGPEKGPDVLRSAPSHPHLQLFFFFSLSLPPSSPRSPVVFPGRFCLAGDPFPRLCGRRGPPESWPCSPLRRPRARLLAPPEAAAPGARAAGRERCLRRHLREREPGCANRLARPARRGGALLANREAKLSPCRTGRKC